MMIPDWQRIEDVITSSQRDAIAWRNIYNEENKMEENPSRGWKREPSVNFQKTSVEQISRLQLILKEDLNGKE